MEIIIKAPFGKLLKMEVLEAKDGFAKITMPYSKELTNPHGFIHGGALCSLADTATAVAIVSKCGERTFFTAKLDMEFKASIEDGEMFAEARIFREKGNFCFSRIELKDGKEKLLATGSAIFFMPSEK
ncbi:PaaI family thioesterase [bacterium]|nr:PaaI family thioesterase [bacterium]